MRILELQIENIKKIKVATITPKGAMVEITGRNGQGKTSALDAIYYGLAGTEGIPSQPLRKGTEKGGVRLDLGDLIVLRRFNEHGSQLYVESKDGARYKTPQAILDKLCSGLTFDPLAFTRMKEKQQADLLKSLVKLDVDPDEIDAVNKAAYDARTELNRSAKALKEQLEKMPALPADLPAERVDTHELLQAMAQAAEHNMHRGRLISQQAALVNAVKEKFVRISQLENEILRMRQQIEEDQTKADAFMIVGEVDVNDLRQRIEAGNATNSLIAQRNKRQQVEAELAESGAAADDLTAAMKIRTEEKHAAIGRAEMPVDGLTFQDGEVYYKDLPFSQASGAEQLRVSIGIAMAANPDLKIIRITDGSLLDEESMKIVEAMAAERDYQIWIERVDSSGKVGIVFEDGEVIAVNEAPKAAPKKTAVAVNREASLEKAKDKDVTLASLRGKAAAHRERIAKKGSK